MQTRYPLYKIKHFFQLKTVQKRKGGWVFGNYTAAVKP